MVTAYLTSNLDDFYRFTWPTEFATMPSVGDAIQAKQYTKRGEGLLMSLTVVHRTFDSKGNCHLEMHFGRPGQDMDWWERMKP